MPKFHVTRDNKVWWSPGPNQPAVLQEVGAIIEVDEKALPHLKGFGYVEGSSHGQSPLVIDTQQHQSTTPDGPNVKPATTPRR